MCVTSCDTLRGMKVHVTARLDERLAAFLETYQRDHQLDSRNEALEHAVRALRDKELQREYAAAMSEWETSGDAEAWDATAADGLTNDAQG